jgi:hypothetical protein
MGAARRRARAAGPLSRAAPAGVTPRAVLIAAWAGPGALAPMLVARAEAVPAAAASGASASAVVWPRGRATRAGRLVGMRAAQSAGST